MSFLFSEDEALKNVLQGIIVSDEKNATRPVGVWFATPDVELRAQSFPYITIEMLDVNWANYRQMSGVVYDTTKQGTNIEVDGVVYRYSVPISYDIMYQVVTYSRHPVHDRQISAYILNNILPAKQGYLPIPDDAGTNVTYRHMMLEEFQKRDMVQDGKRLYRNVFTISVTSEGNAAAYTQLGVAETVVINNNPTHIPIDLQPI